MSTVEKLLVQIFERKNSTIEQVRQQTELYSQHLASKLLINGITPPSWLWDPNASSNSKELNKEELISKLLRPHPQPSARCSFASYPFYSNLVTTGDNEAFSEKSLMENIIFNKGYHRQDDPTIPEFDADDHAGCAINSVPEPDNSVTSPENQTEERLLNIYNAAEQSLSRIRRSRPRQKALELRNSAKSQAKSSSHENSSNSLSNQIRFSLSIIEPGVQKDEVEKSAKPGVGSQSCETSHGGGGADPLSKENEMNLCSGRITGSRSHSQGQVFVRDSLTPGCSSKDCGKRKGADCITNDKEIDSLTDRVTRSKTSSNHHNCAFDSSNAGSSLNDHQRLNTAIKDSLVDDLPPDVHIEDCEAQEPISEDCESHKGRSTRPSLSSGQLNCIKDVPDVETSCNAAKADGGIPAPSSGRSSCLVNNSNELWGSAKLSVGFFHRVTRSQACSSAQEEPVSDCESHRGTLSSSQLNCIKGITDLEIPCNSAKADGNIPAPSSGRSSCLVNDTNELRRSGKPSVGFFRRVARSQTHSHAQEKPEPADYNESPSLAGTKSKFEYKQKSSNVELQNENRVPPLCETHDMHGEHETAHNFILSTAKERRQLESHIVSTASGSFESVEPVQPNFIENEERNLNASDSSSQKRRSASSAENMSFSLTDPAIFVDEGVSGDVNQLSMDKQSVSKSNCKQASANVELQNINEVPTLHETHGVMVSENDTAHDFIISNAKERRQLESHIVSTPSVSFESEALMQPSFIENEDHNLKASASSSQKRRFANPSEKMSCFLSDPAIFVDKGVSGDDSQLSIGKESVSKSNCKQNSANVEVQIVSGSPPLHETHHMLGEHEIACDFSLSNEKERGQLESHIIPIPSGSFESLKPMQANAIGNEECNLKASASCSRKRRFSDSAEKISCSLSDPAIFVDEGVSGNVNQFSMDKQSQRVLDVSIKMEEARCDSFETDARVDPSAHTDRLRPAAGISDNTMVRTTEDNTCCEVNYKNFEAHQEVDIMASKMVDIPNLQIHPSKLQLEYGFEVLQEQHNEEGNQSGEGMDEDELIPNSPDSENLGPSPLQNSAKEPRVDSCDSTIGEVQKKYSICALDKIENSSAQESQNYVFPEGQNAGCSTVVSPPPENSLWRKCAHVTMESWPQLKRRKIERQQTQSSTDPPIPRVRMPQVILRSPASKYLEYRNTSIDTILTETSDVYKSVDVKALHESTFSFHKAEVAFCHEEKNVEKNLSSAINASQLEAANVSRLTKDARNSRGIFVEGTNFLRSSSNYARDAGDGQCSHPEENHNDSSSEDLTLAMLDEMQFPMREGGLQGQPCVLCPSADDLNLVDIDQSMPVLEGFTVDAEVDSGDLEFEANGVNFNKMELPRDTIERASILAEICKSASLNTELPCFSSTLELQGTQNLFQSAPDDHYEHSNMWSALPLNSDVENQLQSGSMLEEDCKRALEAMPYYDFQAYSGLQYDWNSRNHYGSPAGKPWGKLSSHSGSSGKSLNSNPELVCFPIEEDTTSCEENKSADEHVDDVQEYHSDKRSPFNDLTNLDTSVPAQDEMPRADSVDFMSKKLSATAAQDKVQWSTKYQYTDESQTMEKEMSCVGSTNGRNRQTISVGTNEIRKTKESINNSISKTTQSTNASLKRQDQKLSLRESRRNNNVVTSFSSFVPMVQQNKVAAVCTGKRDVKVKSIEAAEAAKRLEEKREIERKMKKEALKLERAKLEEKNLRNMELEKKKKEEERKKRDADIMSRKRLREEEAKKEKEKKRMKLETRQRQREQEEKIRAEKVGKEKQQSKDEQMNSKKEFHNESKKQHNREISKGNETALKRTENKCTSTGVGMNYEECSTSGQSCEVEKAMHTVDKSPNKENLIVQNSQGKSYEISPYQCSDDEDDEEEELPTKKSIPSWASKNSVALLLPLQRDMDPDLVFPPESFCNIDDVLLPQKLQHKLAAT